jgi:hypothetical protein
VVNLAKIESIPIDKLISEIVPNVDSIEIMLENRHMNNLVSLIAPDSHPMAICVSCVSSQLSAAHPFRLYLNDQSQPPLFLGSAPQGSEVRRARRRIEPPPRVLSTKSYFAQACRELSV